MKTTISVPDPIFAAAEKLAARMGVSRSQLYTMALQQFLKERLKSNLTQRVNDAIDQFGQPVDKALLQLSIAHLRKVEW